MAQAQDSERAAGRAARPASFRYVDESERGLEAEAGSAAPASGSRVDDVSLSVAPGRCLVLCGRSGDGKSTVLRLVDGLAGTFFPGDLTGVVEVCGRRRAPARTAGAHRAPRRGDAGPAQPVLHGDGG